MSGRKMRSKKKLNLKTLRRRSGAERIADLLTRVFGTLTFLVFNGVVFALWVSINLGAAGEENIFDPYPFNLLTMVVSLEAIFLAIIVLISQNKASNIEDIREEIDFRVNIQAEREITKILHMLEVMEKKMGIKNGHDTELKAMKKRLNIERIAEEVIHERQQEE